MNALKVGLSNYRTTLAGAGLGAAFYADSVGLQMPSNRNEWFAFIVSLLLAVVGLLAKDAAVGSKPS